MAIAIKRGVCGVSVLLCVVEFLGAGRLLQAVINSAFLSRQGAAVKDRMISSAGDSLSEHNQRSGVRGEGTQRHFEGHAHAQIRRNFILKLCFACFDLTGKASVVTLDENVKDFLRGMKKRLNV